MAAKVKSIPDEYRGATPYLCVRSAATAIDFYKNAFGAREVMRIPMNEGKIGQAELRVGDSPFMLADEFPEMNVRSPQSSGGTPVKLLIYVDDVDALVKRAESAGAKVLRQPADQFYGDRMATLEDPYGHSWSFATHIEDVSPDEMRKRAAAHQT
jgi:PhnB protein